LRDIDIACLCVCPSRGQAAKEERNQSGEN
jgi:hypothetical protein